MIGTHLGPYRVEGKLGAGGMGEVYRARDTRLERDVAIKVLSADFAQDADRVRRFTIEAQATGALNHPNILAVYDIGTHESGTSEGAPYLVAELLEGETLRARMDQGRIPLTKALDLARQVASGLAAAHAKDITHRDIKPENLFVTTDGRVKILDFGLAKQRGDTSEDATRLNSATSAGVVMGTVGYMSPEQVRGEAADPRSDLFSFGVVLYELLSGQRPFIGDSAVETMNAILTEDPPEIVTTGRPLPPALERVVRHCLEKKPDERFQSARDLAFALDALSSSSSTSSAIEAATVRPSRRRLFPMLAAAGAVAAVVLAALAFGQPTSSQLDDYRFTPFSLESGVQSSARWSPDGTAVAYSVAANVLDPQQQQVFVRYLDQPVARQLTVGPGSAVVVGWQAGGQRIMFRRGNALFSVASVGGEPEPVSFEGGETFSRFNPLALNREGNVLATLRRGEDGHLSVWTSSPAGAAFTRYQPDFFTATSNINGRLLEFSPDGRQMLLVVPTDDTLESWVLPYPASASDPPRRVLTDLTDITGVSWMPDNRHVVVAAGALQDLSGRLWMADLSSGARHAITDGSSSIAEAAVSPDGEKLVATQLVSHGSIVEVNVTTAAARPLIANERITEAAAWAADVPLMAYLTTRNGPSEIWLHTPGNPDRPLVTAANSPPGETLLFFGPTPSPTGDRVIYSHVVNQPSGGAGQARLWITATSGGAPVPLTNTSDLEYPGAWSPDGSRFVYLRQDGGSRISLMIVRTSGQATPDVLKSGLNFQLPAWSPDGKWIKYALADGSDHVISPDGTEERALGNPRSFGWTFSKDSTRLFGIWTADDRSVLYSVDVATGAEIEIGTMDREMYEPRARTNPGVRFSLSPDGSSFVYGTFRFHMNLWLMAGFAR